MKNRLTIICLFLAFCAKGQIKVGDNPNTINVNSLLEMESNAKGFLPPRVSLVTTTSISPMTGTVPEGMLVYSTGGGVADGFYYWNGTEWKLISTSSPVNTVTKTANATILKSETMVLASNNITLTLPAITVADNGWEISVKNAGSHTDLVTVQGNTGSNIDNQLKSQLTRYMGQTFVAADGHWVIKEGAKLEHFILSVNEHSSWATIPEAIEYLDQHMNGPVVIRLAQDETVIENTITIDLPYSLTIQGTSFGAATIVPGSGLSGKPMFRCVSECYFKMLQFDATAMGSYGTNPGEDAIRLVGADTYHEIKDCTFDRFYNTILDSSNAELWLFECDISNAKRNGVLLHSNMPGVKLRVAETDFISCARGVNMDKGQNAIVQLMSGAYHNATATDSAIIYNSNNFTTAQTISITSNSWNNTGKFIEGFDFTRSDGRDANVILESNAGIGNKNPNCKIGVLANVTPTTITTGNNWYKANWTNTNAITCKWTVANNRITYQPINKKNGWFMITGNVSCGSPNRTVSIAVVKNGVTTTRYAETSVRCLSSGQPFQFSTVVYLSDIGPGDYFEIFCSTNTSGDNIIMQDVQWLANAQ